jgi:hypothetical protein
LDGECSALTDCNFKGRCPFFKDREAKVEEDRRCKERADKWKAEKKAKSADRHTNICKENSNECDISTS